jgi:hypothetical protein
VCPPTRDNIKAEKFVETKQSTRNVRKNIGNVLKIKRETGGKRRFSVFVNYLTRNEKIMRIYVTEVIEGIQITVHM